MPPSVALRYTDPLLPLALAMAIVALIRAWRRPIERPWLLTGSILILLIISSTPLAALFAKPLEGRYAGLHFVDNGDPIVVLGGACEPSDDPPHMVLGQDSYERLVAAAWLYRSRAPRPVLVTGFQCAPAMAQLLEAQGVAPEFIIQEGRARNTHENATYSAEILRSKGAAAVVLVTDAKSLLRAELCFRKEGIAVVPFSAGLGIWRFDFVKLIPTGQAIRENSDTLHEFIGLLWYRWNGWI
jgi:uncharacterized SAM-binding protein YcdF (DUF218 family)